MNSSLNLKKTPFQQSTSKYDIEKCGVKFTVVTVTETRRTWSEKATQTADGKTLVDWIREDTDAVTVKYNERVEFYDDEHCNGSLVAVVSTSDGPIMGIVLKETTDAMILLDPCVVQYNSRAGTLQLLPIFNVVRKLVLSTTAIRSISVPNDLLISAYPGFLFQNRMGRYALKVEAGTTTNDAKPVQS